MANQNTRKPATRKATTKKAETKQPEVKQEEAKVEQTIEQPKPQRAKVVQIETNELIPVRSMTEGKLIYKNQLGYKWVWAYYGATLDLEFGVLKDMKGRHPAFLDDMKILVDDEDAANALGLTKLYEENFMIEDLDAFFELNFEQMYDILSKLPKGLKGAVATRARKLVEEEKLDEGKKIRLLNEKLGIDLKLFQKD